MLRSHGPKTRQDSSRRRILGLIFGDLCILGGIRGTLKREPLLNPLLALLTRDLIQRVYIPKGPPYPVPYCRRSLRPRISGIYEGTHIQNPPRVLGVQGGLSAIDSRIIIPSWLPYYSTTLS